jgi:hypothetical protein
MTSKNRKNKANSDPAANGRPSANRQPNAKTPPAPAPEVKPPTAAPDPFDPKRLRQNNVPINVGKPSLSVKPCKPHKSWFIRVHPSPDYRVVTEIIELEDDTEKYWVDPDLLPHLKGETTLNLRLLALAVNTQGVFFVWPVPLPEEDGRTQGFVRTALETGWYRVQWDKTTREYASTPAEGDLGEPEWPDVPFRDLLAIAFRGRVIDSLDHVVLRRLRGRVK